MTRRGDGLTLVMEHSLVRNTFRCTPPDDSDHCSGDSHDGSSSTSSSSTTRTTTSSGGGGGGGGGDSKDSTPAAIPVERSMRLRAVSPGLARLLLGGYSDALPAVGLHYLAAGTPVFEPLRGSIGQHGTSWRPSQEGAALVARHATRRVVTLSASTMLAVLRSRTMSLDTLYVRREAGERETA